MSDAGPKLLRGLLEVFILESLEREPKHGYALLKQMAETFGAEPNRNRLYPLLGRMVADGLLREVNESGGNRTLYTLTDAGRDALHSYRRLPQPFRHALRRIWAHEAVTGGDDARVTPPVGADAMAGGITRVEGEVPYPCPDARISVERAPGASDIRISLSGCPMGAYDYCPQCPIYKAVDGVRKMML